MSLTFRQVKNDEVDSYLALVLAAYQPTISMGIHFDAATTTREKSLLHLQNHGVYGLYQDEQIVATVTLRYPWGPLPGPFGLPHIGWFAADPEYPGQHYGSKILHRLEQDILIGQLRAPAVSLGTATNHPWLIEMYRKRGFQPMHQADLGKGHITLYMKKVLDEEAHQRWLARQVPVDGKH